MQLDIHHGHVELDVDGKFDAAAKQDDNGIVAEVASLDAADSMLFTGKFVPLGGAGVSSDSVRAGPAPSAPSAVAHTHLLPQDGVVKRQMRSGSILATFDVGEAVQAVMQDDADTFFGLADLAATQLPQRFHSIWCANFLCGFAQAKH